MRCGSASSQLDCCITLCAQTRGGWRSGMSIARPQGASGMKAVVQVDGSLSRVALVHMQTLKAKDSAVQVTEQTLESGFLHVQGTVQT